MLSLYRQINIKKKDITFIVDRFLDEIKSAVQQGEKVEIRGFGTFIVKKIKEKFSARNPKTGEKVSLRGKHVPHFKPGKELRDRVNNC